MFRVDSLDNVLLFLVSSHGPFFFFSPLSVPGKSPASLLRPQASASCRVPEGGTNDLSILRMGGIQSTRMGQTLIGRIACRGPSIEPLEAFRTTAAIGPGDSVTVSARKSIVVAIIIVMRSFLALKISM